MDKFTIKEILTIVLIMNAFSLSGILIIIHLMKLYLQGDR